MHDSQSPLGTLIPLVIVFAVFLVRMRSRSESLAVGALLAVTTAPD